MRLHAKQRSTTRTHVSHGQEHRYPTGGHIVTSEGRNNDTLRHIETQWQVMGDTLQHVATHCDKLWQDMRGDSKTSSLLWGQPAAKSYKMPQSSSYRGLPSALHTPCSPSRPTNSSIAALDCAQTCGHPCVVCVCVRASLRVCVHAIL